MQRWVQLNLVTTASIVSCFESLPITFQMSTELIEFNEKIVHKKRQKYITNEIPWLLFSHFRLFGEQSAQLILTDNSFLFNCLLIKNNLSNYFTQFSSSVNCNRHNVWQCSHPSISRHRQLRATSNFINCFNWNEKIEWDSFRFRPKRNFTFGRTGCRLSRGVQYTNTRRRETNIDRNL